MVDQKVKFNLDKVSPRSNPNYHSRSIENASNRTYINRKIAGIYGDYKKAIDEINREKDPYNEIRIFCFNLLRMRLVIIRIGLLVGYICAQS